MDSVTQAVLGSAVAVAASGQVTKKMVITGALLATLPDLDLFIPSANELERMLSHRTWSHSLLTQPLLALLFAFIFRKLFPTLTFRRLAITVFLVFVTHALLDSFTVFGTFLFWPLTVPSVMISSVFIIDPLYTVPLILSFIYLLFARHKQRAFKFNNWMLIISSLYLCWSVAAQHYVKGIARESFAAKAIQADKVLVTPMAFNTLLWRVVAINDDNYYEGFYSLLADNGTLKTTAVKRNTDLLAGLDSAVIDGVTKFSHGLYSVFKNNDQLIMQDLRMGFGEMYSFQFVVASKENNQFIALDANESQQVEVNRLGAAMPSRTTLIKRVWQRIWHTQIQFFP